MGVVCKEYTQAPHPQTCLALSAVLAQFQDAELSQGAGGTAQAEFRPKEETLRPLPSAEPRLSLGRAVFPF